MNTAWKIMYLTLLSDDYAPTFQATGRRKILIIVSDGKDTCNTDGVYDPDGDDAASLQDLTDTTLALLNQEISTLAVGFDEGVYVEALNAIAQTGGTRHEQYLSASDDATLSTLLQEISASYPSCILDIGEFENEDADLSFVNLYFDDVPIPRNDRPCTPDLGWYWTDDTLTKIAFCEETCNLLKSGEVHSVDVEIFCGGDIVPVL